MDFKQLIINIKDKIKEKVSQQNEEDDLPDDVTRDKYLRSLRRQRRVQMEEVEKKQLKEDIAEFEKNRLRENLFSMKDKVEKKEQLMNAVKKKKINILKQKNMFEDGKNMLKNGKALKKIKGLNGIKEKETSFYGKGDLL